jgi:cyclopropane fatty-acyl-phospholipid synthase-like methyltransferase
MPDLLHILDFGAAWGIAALTAAALLLGRNA